MSFIFQVIKISTEFRASLSKLEYFNKNNIDTSIFLPRNLLKQSTSVGKKKSAFNSYCQLLQYVVILGMLLDLFICLSTNKPKFHYRFHSDRPKFQGENIYRKLTAPVSSGLILL